MEIKYLDFNYFKGLKKVISKLRIKYAIISDMLKNKNYQKQEFNDKLEGLEYAINISRKAISKFAKI